MKMGILIALAFATMFLGIWFGLKVVSPWLESRRRKSMFTEAEQLMLKHTPPEGFNPGDCVAVPTNPDDPTGYVKYVLVVTYSVLELPIDGQERVWMLHCDDGKSYLHTRVTRVPGGMPDGAASTVNPTGPLGASPPPT